MMLLLFVQLKRERNMRIIGLDKFTRVRIYGVSAKSTKISSRHYKPVRTISTVTFRSIPIPRNPVFHFMDASNHKMLRGD